MSLKKFKPKTLGEFSAKVLEEAKARRPVQKPKRVLRHFDCQVEQSLFEKANALRTTTWVELVDQLLRLVAVGIDLRDLVRAYCETVEELEGAIVSEYQGTKQFPKMIGECRVRRELAAKIERAFL